MKTIKMMMVVGVMFFMSGCIMTGLKDKSYDPTNGEVTRSVCFYRGSFLSVTTFEDAEVDYQGIKFKLTKYMDKGDAESIQAISKLVTYAMMAYFSGGSVPITQALIEALRNGEVDRVLSKSQRGETITIADFPTACKYSPVKIKEVK